MAVSCIRGTHDDVFAVKTMVNREKEYAALKNLWSLFPAEEQAVGANMDYISSTYDGIRFCTQCGNDQGASDWF